MNKFDEVIQPRPGVGELRVRVDAMVAEQARHAELLLRHERAIGQLQGMLTKALPKS